MTSASTDTSILITPPVSSTSILKSNSVHVVIVGCGLSGLSLAYYLLSKSTNLKQRISITLFEGRNRIGGRLFSLPGNLDLGASWHWSHHNYVKQLADEIGVKSFEEINDDDCRRFEGGCQELVEKLWKKMSNMFSDRVIINLSQPVTSIKKSNEGVDVYVSNGKIYQCNIVVVALPPRLSIKKIEFSPSLDDSESFLSVTTWMGSSSKVVLRFAEPFWQQNNGYFRFSRYRPIKEDVIFEWHDASSKDDKGNPVYALFGFGTSNVTQERVIIQLKRMFGVLYQSPILYSSIDWSKEEYTSATPSDGYGSHPEPTDSLRMSRYDGRLYFGSTETADREAGYMEGAVRRSQELAKEIIKRLER